MKTSQKGIDLLCELESFSSVPYLCKAKHPTIGYGSTDYNNGTKVTMDDPPITKEYAIQLLRADLVDIEERLNAVAIPFTQGQFDALVSFFYNLGTGKITDTNSSIGIAIKSKDTKVIGDMMLIYNKIHVDGVKQVCRGLVNRRKREHDLYIS